MTKTIISLIAAVILFAAVPANAETATFGVVDVNKIMQKSTAANDVMKQLEEKRKEYQKEIAKEENSLRDEEKKIIAQKDKISKEDMEKKRKEFGEKVMKGQKGVQEQKMLLDRAFNVYMSKIRTEITKAVASIAKSKNYSTVLTQNSVMLFEPSADMTDAVIEELNKSVKSMKIDWAEVSAKK